MTLTLVIPGLLWPPQVMRDTLHGADFPALQTLLGKGRMTPASASTSTATSTDIWWAAYFGSAAEKFAAAPLRLVAAGIDPGESRWLCADLVNLRVTQKGAMLTDPALLNIDVPEARQLHDSLAPLFADIGELVMTTPSQWHLRLKNAAPALPAQLADLIEQSAADLLPAGAEGRQWRQVINEAQMALHTHAVNATRSAEGKAAVNSIALWGEGYAPALSTRQQLALMSDDPIIAGAGMLAGMQVSALASSFELAPKDCVVLWDHLRFPAAQHDALAWRDGLQQLDADWLAPALAALKNGKLKRIVLHGFGEDKGVSVALSKMDLHRFWRKPRRLESL